MIKPHPLNRIFRGVFLLMALGCVAPGWADVQQNSDNKAVPINSVVDDGVALKKDPLPLTELRVLTEVMQRIKSTYIEKVDDKTLLESAIRGMLNDLDPHSAYLKPEDFKKLEISTSGEFGGLGIEVGMEDGYVKIISPIDDTPAYKAGLKAGDLIIRLDDGPVKGMTLMQAIEKMRGKAGATIKLTILRDGVAKPFDVRVKRDIIKVQSVRTKTLEDGYGYIRISLFQSNTDKELLTQLKALRKEQKGGQLKGVVLDLRNNPGGVLQAAVGVTDAFLKEGLIVYTKGREPNSELRFNATQSDPSKGVPLVVLINDGSASASEIVAGALQDHHRAVLVGNTTFGKGSVQSVLPLSVDSKRGIKLTTALYYTPGGRSIQAEGIKPDIELPRVKVTPLDVGTRYKEADLKGHLINGNGNKAKEKTNVAKEKDNPKNLLEEDYQLSQALNIVKGISIRSQPDTTKVATNQTK